MLSSLFSYYHRRYYSIARDERKKIIKNSFFIVLP